MNLRSSLGDRFISSRGLQEDASSLFGTKVEIFSHDEEESDSEERRANTLVNASSQKEQSLLEEENKKMYTALLQN